MSNPVYLGMPHNMGPQFIRVFRGLHPIRLHDQDMSTINTEDIGPHWTTDHSVAENIASGNPVSRGDRAIKRNSGVHGVVLEGLVHKDDIKPFDQHSRTTGIRKIFPPTHAEKEITVEEGGTVHLTRAAKMAISPRNDEANDISYEESQDFSSPIKATVQDLNEDYIERQHRAGRKEHFDTGVKE